MARELGAGMVAVAGEAVLLDQVLVEGHLAVGQRRSACPWSCETPMSATTWQACAAVGRGATKRRVAGEAIGGDLGVRGASPVRG